MLDPRTLPNKTQEKLLEVTAKSLDVLTEEDKAFLNARRNYLRPEQVQVFLEVLENPAKATKDIGKQADAKEQK